jgi:SAM-dependent methyltransferase
MELPSLTPLEHAASEDLQRLLAAASSEAWFVESFRSLETPAAIPEEFIDGHEFWKVGLVDDALVPRFRVNELRGRFFITDTPPSVAAAGVYAYADEAEQLLGVSAPYSPFVSVGDVGTGCGHAVVCLDALERRFAVDIDPRAVALARINARLNGVVLETAVSAVGGDFPPSEWSPLWSEGSLLLANLPFVISRVSDGGATGLQPISRLLASLSPHRGCGTLVILLVYTLGAASRAWAIEEIMDLAMPDCARDFNLLSDALIWRVNGTKRFTNPMLLDDLPSRADCHLTFTDRERDDVRRSYTARVRELKDLGWTVLGYGTLRFVL